MAFIDGRDEAFTLDSNDLSAYLNSVKFSQKADSHDVTTYGADNHAYHGGLLDGTIDIEGFYQSGSSGPAAVVPPLLGTVVAFEHDPEGDATGKPKITGNVLVLSYDESVPVADMITWSASLQITGAVTRGTVSE